MNDINWTVRFCQNDVSSVKENPNPKPEGNITKLLSFTLFSVNYMLTI